MRYYSLGPNRYLCDVFSEMRKCCETLNFSYLKALIEEAQVMGNRMEAKLNDVADLEQLRDRIKDAENELKELEKKCQNMKAD